MRGSRSGPVEGASRRVVLRGLVVSGAALGLAACSGRETSAEAGSPAPSGGAAPSVAPEPTTTGPDAADEPSAASTGAEVGATVVATSVVDELRVHEAPADPDDRDDPVGEQVTRVLDRRDEVSGQVVLLALEVGRAWVHVQLPVRPNGSTGWVRARDVGLSSHSFAIEILLGEHRIVVTEAGREVLGSDIGVGTTDTPTPGGDYYVKELLAPPDPDGVYGPYAYGLSGFSTVLTEFNGGEGVIGIHGTDRPDLVGTDVSSGCIRLPNDVITRLVEEVGLPLGTPVTIRA
ncbi:L,D-transpeptidase family protein [Jannaschia sp. R86511]|uniref:L,D-transpeptidase family protein n=1 Tax=Jannaschia sp. R86511 TaxID=3093853 RepID=UPI0036D35E81